MLNKTLKGLVLLFVLTVTSFSCEENDDSTDASGDLIGNWELTSYTTNGDTTVSAQGNTITSNFDGKALNIDYIITFSEDPNKATTQNGSYDIEVTTSVSGISSTETATVSDINGEANWSRNGNIITFTGDFISFETDAIVLDEELSENVDYIIEELTDTSLILAASVSEQISDPDIGFDIDVDINLRLTFTRI